MSVIKVKDFARIIENLDGVTRVKCFTDELDDENENKDNTFEYKGNSLSYIRCNSSCAIM